MNFSQIQSFYLVAQLGTYQAAAERLHASQPAISARISALENSLKVTLFDRSGYRVALTPEGRVFMDFAEQMLELQRKTLLAIQGQGDMSGMIRIGASDTMVSSWLPDFLIDFEQEHPNLGVELFVRASPLLEEDLLNHTIDVAWLVGQVRHENAHNLDFCDCPMGFLAAPQLGLHGRPLGVGDLQGANLLTFEKVTQPYQDLRRSLKRHNITAKINPISALHTITLLMRKGLGIGCVPLAPVEQEIENGELMVLDMPIFLPDLRFTLSYLDGPQRPLAEAVASAAMRFLKARQANKNIKILYRGA